MPIVTGQDPNEKMEEGEHFAIETFGSTGRGWVRDQVRRFSHVFIGFGVRLTYIMTSRESVLITPKTQT